MLSTTLLSNHLSRFDPPQILHRPLRLVLLKFAQAVVARGDGENFGAEGPTAADVQRRITDDQRLVAAQILVKHPPSAFERDGGNLVTVFAVISKRSGLEFLPKIEVAQFDFGPEPDIAREQPGQRWFGQRLQPSKELPHPGTHRPLALLQGIVQ